jgi:hypothetical protein
MTSSASPIGVRFNSRRELVESDSPWVIWYQQPLGDAVDLDHPQVQRLLPPDCFVVEAALQDSGQNVAIFFQTAQEEL